MAAITPTQVKTLSYLAENGPTKLWPIGTMPTRKRLNALVDSGFIVKAVGGPMSFVTYSITDAGRSALRAGGGE